MAAECSCQLFERYTEKNQKEVGPRHHVISDNKLFEILWSLYIVPTCACPAVTRIFYQGTDHSKLFIRNLDSSEGVLGLLGDHHRFEESHLFRLILTVETRVFRLGRRNHQSPSSFESEAAAGEPTLFSGVGLGAELQIRNGKKQHRKSESFHR